MQHEKTERIPRVNIQKGPSKITWDLKLPRTPSKWEPEIDARYSIEHCTRNDKCITDPDVGLKTKERLNF